MSDMLQLTIGRLYCRDIRYFLNQCQFKGHNVEFIESKGLLQRHFTIKGDSQIIETIKITLDNWLKQFEN